MKHLFPIFIAIAATLTITITLALNKKGLLNIKSKEKATIVLIAVVGVFVLFGTAALYLCLH